MLLLIAFVMLYVGMYFLARGSHILVHATLTWDRTNEMNDFEDGILPGNSMTGEKPSVLALSSWYLFFPLRKSETASILKNQPTILVNMS